MPDERLLAEAMDMHVSELVGRVIDYTYQSARKEAKSEFCEAFLDIKGIGLIVWPISDRLELVATDEIVGLPKYDTVRDLLFEEQLPIKGIWQRQGGDCGLSSPVLLEMQNDYWLDFWPTGPVAMNAVGIHPMTWRDVRREKNRASYQIVQLA